MTPDMVTAVDIPALKARLKATWMSGDYARFATYMLDGALELVVRNQIPSGATVLDVACGAGQTALPMARNGNKVTGIDIATNLIETARQRAEEAGLNIRFDEGDAEELPYADASFDVVFTLFGAMFAPQPHLVAEEMTRVVRPNGRIIMGNWTPDGFIGQMFKIVGAYVPPAQGVPSPTLWGDERTVEARLGSYVSELQLTRRLYPFKYPFSPAQVVEFFRQNYGPTNRAFNSLDADRQAELRRELTQHWAQGNIATDGTTFVEAEFLDVQALRR